MPKSTVLLIGGSGYIGQALHEKLQKKYTVYVTTRNRKKLGLQQLCMESNNLESIEKALSKHSFNYIVILAADISGLNDSAVDLTKPVFQTNVMGLQNILNGVKKHQPTAHLYYVSSMTVYSPDAVSPVSEDAALLPFHNYGLSKLMAEKLFSFFITTTQNSGVIIRLPGIFGGKKKTGFFYNAVQKLITHQPLEIKTTNLKYWEPLYIDDLSRMFLDFLQSYRFEKNLEVFNFSYGKEVDLIRTAQLLKKMLDSKSKIQIIDTDYKPFYLDNQKLKQTISLEKYSFETALNTYLKKVL